MKTAWLTACVLVVLSCASAQHPGTAPSEYTAFVDFTVVPTDTPRVLRKHTVLVSDGLVRTVGPALKDRVPAFYAGAGSTIAAALRARRSARRARTRSASPRHGDRGDSNSR
jgi:hypothetical protein